MRHPSSPPGGAPFMLTAPQFKEKVPGLSLQPEAARSTDSYSCTLPARRQGKSALKTGVRQSLREIQVCPTAALPASDPGPWPQPPVCPQTSLLKSWRELNSDRTSHPHCPLCLIASRGAHWLMQASACTCRRNHPPPPSSPFQRCQPSQVAMLPL